MTASVARWALPGFLAIAVAGISPAVAQAQTKPQPTTPAKPQTKPKPKYVGPKWEVEVHGSLAIPTGTPSGVDTTPAAGQTFTLGDGTTSSRAVHSWFFGSGASFLNQILALRGISPRITPIDEIGWPVASHQLGAQAGGRIARRITNVMWIEFSADLGMEPLGFDAEALERIEDSRASFVTAFTALNNSTPTLMPNPTVSAAANVVSGGRRLVTTGAVQFRAPGTGLRPFAVVGAGIMTPIGGDTTLELVGQYRLSTPSGNVFDETDRMILRYRTSSSFVVLAGLGYTGDLSPRSGWRAELRVMFGSLALETTLDTQPEISVTTPTGAAILNGTNPGLQFATNGLRTNLSAPALQGFAALSASGRTTVWVASGGYYWRF